MAEADKTLHIAMYPWFALGHITAFSHTANKLAERGHKISFFLPANTLPKFEAFNHFPDLITFIPITVPHVEGLPYGVETTNDVPRPLHPLLMTAMDLTQPFVEVSLHDLQPQIVFFDFTCWMPALARKLGIKSLNYFTISAATAGYLLSPARKSLNNGLTATDLLVPPEGFPSSTIKLRTHEARGLAYVTTMEYGSGISFLERHTRSLNDCDAIAFKTCKEVEGTYCDYMQNQFQKPVLLAGPVVPEPPNMVLDGKWENVLNNFQAKTVVFCAFGSECVLKVDQLHELVLGLELTGLPFLVALKPPMEYDTIEAALPEGFLERVEGKGYVHGGWVPQQLILMHPSVGCFVTHCGCGSLAEAMMTECQLVLLPNVGDQIINARLTDGELGVGVEVEKGDEDGQFKKDGVCKAVKAVMDEDSEVGKERRTNHAKWTEFLISPGLENSYLDAFVQGLRDLL